MSGMIIPRFLLKVHVASMHERGLASGRRALLTFRRYSSHSAGDRPKSRKSNSAEKNARKKETARAKLDGLLSSIRKVSPASDSGGVSDRLSRPGAVPRPRNVVPAAPEDQSEQRPTAPQQRPADKANGLRRAKRQPKTDTATATLDEEVTQAARDVALALGGDTKQTEMDLLRKLNGDEEQKQGSNADSQPQLSDLISSMRITPQQNRADQVRDQLGGDRAGDVSQVRRARPRTAGGPSLGVGLSTMDVDLHNGPGLGIFPEPQRSAVTGTESEEAGTASLWEQLQQREMQLSVTHPPANAWEQMVLWTEQGKLWKLPVNNEDGLDQEEGVGFHQHVFLEDQLEPWCPPQGPVRHFMELVCVGLGKNPWLSVAEKHEHIAWFQNYFAEKHELLAELKAI